MPNLLGTAPNQVPTNADLGTMAFQDAALYQNINQSQAGFKNRIINGAMMIDQRNAGASVTPSTDTYTLDRMLLRQPSAIYSAQRQTAVVPPNFGYALKLTVANVQGSVSSGTVNNLTQYVEGFNIADFGWGTANAAPVTLSFWVRSSITGTYSAALYNDGFTRAYVATYTVNSANTWEQKSITITGDTSGTWSVSNAIGVAVTFDLGSGSSYNGTAGSWGSGAIRTSGSVSLSTNAGATFYITGVQLEKGSTATSFDYRPYGTELALCQRYYEKSYSQSQVPGTIDDVAALWGSVTSDSTLLPLSYGYKVTKRTSPTVTIYNSATGAANSFQTGSTNYTVAAVYGSDAVLGRVYSTTSMASNAYSRVCFVAAAEL